MYKVVSHTRKFDMDNPEDNKSYEEILNDPLCIITTERIEKTREEEYSENTGRISRSHEVLWRIVTWNERVLIT